MCLTFWHGIYYSHSSDELLVQDDGSDVSFISTEFSKGMHLGSGDPTAGLGRSNRASNPNANSLIQRYALCSQLASYSFFQLYMGALILFCNFKF